MNINTMFSLLDVPKHRHCDFYKQYCRNNTAQ